MADLIAMLGAAAGAAAGGGEVDPNFNQTVLLLHGDGTNGAQNNTFLDSSANNFTITRNGNTTQGTFSPFSAPDGRWSNYFDGTGDYLSVPSSTGFELDGDFTIEMWIYKTKSTGASAFDGLVYRSLDWRFKFQESNNIINYDNGTDAQLINYTGAVPMLNNWHHLAFVRSGTTLTGYVDGVSYGSATVAGSFTASGSALIIGDNAGSAFGGYISNVRIVKGTAVYTSGFTPSTSPLTAISNTQLLTCQSNRFVDNSSNAFAITVNGDTKVTPFSPFAPTAAYSASVNGGSGYFDGTSDNLSVANNSAFQFGTGDFTVEAWVYQTVQRSESQIIVKCSVDNTWNGGWTLNLAQNESGVRFWINGSNVSTSGANTVALNGWSHVAVSRSGTTLKMFIDGVEVDSDTNSTNIVPIVALTIGADITPSALEFQGYISNVRVVKGTALYTSAFTPPTAPLTAVSGTSLLCNFTNAGIFDNTGKNNLETVADAQIDTTTKKYGTGAMEFDGTGDVLIVPYNQDINISSGDFTLEAWVYYTNATSFFHVFAMWDASNLMWQCYIATSNNSIEFSTSSNGSTSTALTSSSSVISPSTWTHLAIVRSAGTVTVYVNGSSVASGARTIFNGTSKLSVGGRADGSFYGTGFVDDLRITKGVARYTANFTPPTAAFPNL